MDTKKHDAIKALRAMMGAFDIGQKATPTSAIGRGRAALEALKETRAEENRRAIVLKLAQNLHEDEGGLEFDEDAVVSEGDDNGAYVQAWKWIDFSETHLDKEDRHGT